MFNDMYLKFPDEAAAKAVLFDGDVPLFRNIDTIGVITKQVDEEATETLPGWHVNVRLVEEENSEALEPYQVFPSTPSRVWA